MPLRGEKSLTQQRAEHVYAVLEKHATDGKWSGTFRDFYREHLPDIPEGAQSYITRRLVKTGSIIVTSRTHFGHGATQVTLVYPPTDETWLKEVEHFLETGERTDAAIEGDDLKTIRSRRKSSSLDRRLTKLEQRIGPFDILETFAAMNDRIDTLTREVGKLHGTP